MAMTQIYILKDGSICPNCLRSVRVSDSKMMHRTIYHKHKQRMPGGHLEFMFTFDEVRDEA